MNLKEVDEDMFNIIESEKKRLVESIQLIPSEVIF
jgi:glycine/serine hydroxymethyltransferase